MIRKSSRAIEDSAPSRSTHVVPDPNISETRSRTASASSDEELFEGHASTRYALRLAPLIFVRPGELRKAEWTEFNLVDAEWRIPAAKMKMRRPHRKPLAYQALTILRELQGITGGSKYLFPSVRSWHRIRSVTTRSMRRCAGSGMTRPS
jgi:integrase